MSMTTPLYRRVLVKISGEALMGGAGFGLDPATVDRIAEEVAGLRNEGVEVALVVGGGNIFRGVQVAASGIDRATGDYMGMLATVMNALALGASIERFGATARVMSALEMPAVCETFSRPKALRHFERGHVMIFAAGTGNPFFTTDTAAALRAAEMGCDALLKATNVDGVYTADPKKDPTAVRYDRVSYDEAIARDLKVMDAAAFALARENRIPVIVFSIHEPGSIKATVMGNGRGTLVGG
ncbi:UMP kinase [Terrihabitans rhizophilus]|jgi:uridylate kinase|uniref:Uridylate kinase n=1 Tax=Terrihabitans rhizophilus TaxID=3092662 RepID=A0ABU4RMN2_9HYPH|nr:UMP kinase [Terrihabitans sp. PJ23]MDX6805473.1 UMP kinase [Terrihabitans sp. PJ23]